MAIAVHAGGAEAGRTALFVCTRGDGGDPGKVALRRLAAFIPTPRVALEGRRVGQSQTGWNRPSGRAQRFADSERWFLCGQGVLFPTVGAFV